MGLIIFNKNIDPNAIIGYSALIGASKETIDAFITESGGTVFCNVEKDGGGDLTLIYSDAQTFFDSTPIAQIALTPGTDTVPIQNWVYILKSTNLLTVNTSGFPAAEHVPIGRFIVQTAASVALDGVYKNHLYTDHLVTLGGNGHISHLNSWIRAKDASWVSGIDQTLTITPGSPDTVIFTTLEGKALQLHEHTFPAFPGTPDIYVINDSVTLFNVVTDLNALLTDSLGMSMSNRYFALVIWGVINQETGESKLFLNLPSGSYASESDLLEDVSNLSNFTIPSEFVGVGFLISELKLRHQTAGGGTWTSIIENDLRGSFPSTSIGGGGGGGTKHVSNKGIINEMQMIFASVSTVSIGIGTCRNSTDTFDIANIATRTADITASGAGGLDTGVEAADTWYALFIIDDSSEISTEAAMLSLSATAPTMPAGYDVFRRIGWVRNDSSSNFLKFLVFGNGNKRDVVYDENTTVTEVLSVGTAIVFTDIDLTSFVPPNIQEVIAFMELFLKDDTDFLSFRPDGSSVTFGGSPWRFQTTKNAAANRTKMTKNLIAATSRIIEYQLSFADNNLSLSVAGYTDHI